ncbi:MAG: ATP-dependent Clp protease proteolytic subunit [Oscillospiraceae bacterium]|nr:ATP-dependent Clp protease proteolytic subunit [Oscillospiraceae bacterium]
MGVLFLENEEIKELGSLTERNIHCIAVIGQIEGHQLLAPDVKTTKYEHLLPQLAAVEESPDIDGLLILINTCGGDVEAGLAIAELISGMKKPTASLVLGGGHSIGVPLAVAADMCFIAPSAAMTIHPVRLSGTVIGVSQTYNYLARIQERIVRFITQNSRIEEGKLTELMLKTGELAGDVGSVVYGEETVELGLADRVGGLSDALGYLHGRIDKVKKRETQDPA